MIKNLNFKEKSNLIHRKSNFEVAGRVARVSVRAGLDLVLTRLPGEPVPERRLPAVPRVERARRVARLEPLVFEQLLRRKAASECFDVV